MHHASQNMIPDEKLGQFVIAAPALSSDDFGEKAKEIFESSAHAEGIVVLSQGRPIGIIMRNHYFQRMSSLYGNSLYMKRPVSILMQKDVLSADVGDSISKVGQQAMSRDPERLYDFIVVCQNGSYAGVISIRLFLEELSKRHEAQIYVLKQQQQKLLLAHEQELQLRKNVEYQANAIHNLLDHAEQGFLWFGSDLMIRNEVSYQCLQIFDRHIGGIRFLDLIAPYFDENRIEVFRMAFDSYFRNNNPVTDTVYLMLLPSDCVIGERNIHFQYKRIEGDQQKAVMVIMNDITDKIALERAMEADRYKQRLLIKAFGCQPQIKRMIDEFRELFCGGFRNFFTNDSTFQENLNELFRVVHTYKGDFAQYGFDAAADKLHVLEDELSAFINAPTEKGVEALEQLLSRANTEEILHADLQVVADFLGSGYFDKSEVISVPKSRLIDLENQLRTAQVLHKAEVISLIRSLRNKSVKDCLAQYGDYIEYLSGRVAKSVPIILVEGDDVEIDSDRFDPFLHSLIHLFRNCMDHGIETDEERVQRGKNQQGMIRCSVSIRDEQHFELRIADDGRGVDTEKLKSKVLERDLYTAEQLTEMDQDAICSLMFEDYVSTKDDVSSLSGRGVGMSAVKNSCSKLGGKIRVETRLGKGTAFIMAFPLLKNQ